MNKVPERAQGYSSNVVTTLARLNSWVISGWKRERHGCAVRQELGAISIVHSYGQGLCLSCCLVPSTSPAHSRYLVCVY